MNVEKNLENTRCFKTYSESNKKTQSLCLKKSWALFEECWRGKKMEMFRLLPAKSTWRRYATSNIAEPCSNVFFIFSLHFSTAEILEFMQHRGGQKQEQVHTFQPSQECFQGFPLPKGAKPLANHSFKNVWLKQQFYESILKIDCKNWT